MENIKRSIKLFFATKGNFLFSIIASVAIVLLALRGVDFLYQKNLEKKGISTQIVQQLPVIQQEENDANKQLIATFLDYCNHQQIKEAYQMLSQTCIDEKYTTQEKFQEEYVNLFFPYEKEYKIEKEAEHYKVTITDGILQSGSIDNRKSMVCFYKIENTVLENKIFIER